MGCGQKAADMISSKVILSEGLATGLTAMAGGHAGVGYLQDSLALSAFAGRELGEEFKA